MIAFYKVFFSQTMGGSCRFQPTCSDYAIESYKTHCFFKATALTAKRIVKCRPGSDFGFDPVPHSGCGDSL